MTWQHAGDDWWRGSEGAWVCRSAEQDCDRLCLDGEQCHVIREQPFWIGWRDFGPPLFWYATRDLAMRAVEKCGVDFTIKTLHSCMGFYHPESGTIPALHYMAEAKAGGALFGATARTPEMAVKRLGGVTQKGRRR